MFSTLGFGFLGITFILSIYGAGAALYAVVRGDDAWAESARLAMLAVFPTLTVSILALLALLVMGDMQVDYVYNVISNSMVPLRVSSAHKRMARAGSRNR